MPEHNLRRFEFHVEGIGSGEKSATFEGWIDARNVCDATDVLSRKMRELDWRDRSWRVRISPA